MKTILPCSMFVAGLLALAANGQSASASLGSSQGGHVQVIFDHPENFADLQTRADGAADPQVLEPLRDFIEQTAAPRIGEGATLTITFTDVDLAGAFTPPKTARQLKSVHPPKAKFMWTLTDAKGVVVKQGTERLIDSGYLTQSNLKRDPLFYEKEMLEVWIRRTFR